MISMRCIARIAVGALLLLCVGACTAPPHDLTISAAANLQPALSEIVPPFEKQTGTRLTLNFGSTGMLAQQIAQGAPVDLFVSADRATVEDLAKRGFIDSGTVRVYARGEIVLYTRHIAPGTPPLQLADLDRPGIKRVAIANPERAPYGQAAEQALQNANLWNSVQTKLIIAENIQQTMQYAESGNVDAAIVARSLTVGSKGQWAPIAQELYQPLDQALGVIKGRPNEASARAFADFLGGAQAQAVLTKYGYIVP